MNSSVRMASRQSLAQAAHEEHENKKVGYEEKISFLRKNK